MNRIRPKLVKQIVAEVTQWAAFATPLFVTGVEFGKLEQMKASYWLVVSVTIGYVAASTLLLWLPVKLVFDWMKLLTWFNGQWSPPILLYFILTSLPCCVIIMVGTKFANNFNENKDFQNSCVELLVIMLLVTDWSEKLKNYKLRMSHPVPSVNSITDYPPSSRGSVTSLIPRPKYSSAWTDERPPELIANLLNIYDVRLMFATSSGEVTSTNWIYAIYVISFISISTFILKHDSSYRPIMTLILLDCPFFVLRLSMLARFGQVTSILFLLKNFFVITALLYFNLIVPKLSTVYVTPRINTVDYDVTNQRVDYDVNNQRQKVDSFDSLEDNRYHDYDLNDTPELPRPSTHPQYYDHHNNQYDVTDEGDVTKPRRHRGTLSEDLFEGNSPEQEPQDVTSPEEVTYAIVKKKKAPMPNPSSVKKSLSEWVDGESYAVGPHKVRGGQS
nr:transmembrane protein 236-like [Ciona intestinalis]|eukprot:XP_002125397.3 transmembrane protein 236-like [Ciona intestinalis]